MRVPTFLSVVASLLAVSRVRSSSTPAACSSSAFQVIDEPFENYFLSDCHAATQVVVSTDLPAGLSGLNSTNARIVVAWPAGNSGVVTYFGGNGTNETLGLTVVNSTVGSPLGSIYEPATATQNATVGISMQIDFNASASLNLATLGSIRTIRDWPSTLHPELQEMNYTTGTDGSVTMSRLWLDNITTTWLSFVPVSGGTVDVVNGTNTTLVFESGSYLLNASFNYPQLVQMTPDQIFTSESSDLVTTETLEVNSLTFLSYTTKFLAGGWHFLTYFGRDSMISALLLFPVLSQGNGSSVETVISAAIERLEYRDGAVCHEEVIGDYATWTNQQDNITSTAPGCTYAMIDVDYYLPVLMAKYFVDSATGATRIADFFAQHPSFFPNETNLTYADKALRNGERVMRLAAPFTAPGNQTIDNLVQLKPTEPVGDWRDSNAGLGGGRFPFDVNTALMPAALRAVGKLARAGVYNESSWTYLADEYASVWEVATLPLFEVSVPAEEAVSRIEAYVNASSFAGPNQTATILDNGEEDVTFYALALNGSNDPFVVETMHSDTSFRMFFVNDTNDEQLARFLNQTAKSVMWTFPAGLLSDVGIFVANPAYGDNTTFYAETWTAAAYQGIVVWCFQMSMMARGFELQLSRCNDTSLPQPAFCRDPVVLGNVRTAYTKLWDAIDTNSAHLTNEVWSWTYSNGSFAFEDYSEASPGEEEDGIQLWSLTFLAVTKNDAFIIDT